MEFTYHPEKGMVYFVIDCDTCYAETNPNVDDMSESY